MSSKDKPELVYPPEVQKEMDDMKKRMSFFPHMHPGDSRPPSAAVDPFEHCGLRSVLSLGAGAALGGVFGLFMGSVDNSYALDPKLADMSTKDQIKHSFRQMKVKSSSYAKNFAVVGGLYSGVECMVSKHRAKHDLWNPAISGCIAGGILGVRSGPGAALGGCVTFGAFSVAIDYYMET